MRLYFQKLTCVLHEAYRDGLFDDRVLQRVRLPRRERRKRRDGLVFTRETNQRANAVIKRWCRAARIKKTVTYHTSRHTFCVLLLTKGVPIYTVQRLMGHSDIATTNIYADLLNRTKAKAVCKLPAIPGRTAM